MKDNDKPRPNLKPELASASNMRYNDNVSSP